ncbi:MAG: hypothetical protein ACKO83_12200, partial [Roseiflexaceae bacterium]
MRNQAFGTDQLLLGVACLLVAAALLWFVVDDSSVPQPVADQVVATATVTVSPSPVFTALASILPTDTLMPTVQSTATIEVPLITPSD